MLLLLGEVNLPVFASTHNSAVIKSVLLNDSTFQVQYFKEGQWPQRQSHLWQLVSPLHSPSPSLKPFLAKHLCIHAMNQIRELVCIKTSPKEAWPAFSFPAHYMAVQSLGLAQGKMK